MRLKRLYDQEKITRDADGHVIAVAPGAVRAVRIQYAPMVQKFTPRLILQGSIEGWILMEGDRITIQGEDGVLIYQIDAAPGYYCCFCEAATETGVDAIQHLETMHMLPSPDTSNPTGYRQDNFYLCTRKD